MSRFSRGQQAQISKRVRLRGEQPFTAKDKKCLICGHRFGDHACIHTVEENQEVLELFT
jgi:hypothetical protein